VKAVNLIPADAGRISGHGRELPRGPAYVVLALLGIALAFVTVYVLTTNTISQRKAKLAAIQQQATEVQAQAQRLANYAQFAKLAQERADTVRQLASSRFDWHAALSDLSKVVPADTSLQSLLGTVAPGVAVTGPGGGVGGASPGDTSTLRSDIANPAFELRGCTKTQDDVARLMSRLRVMNGVTRVTLADSVKQDAAAGAATVSTAGASSGGCHSNQPSFDLVVFFQPLPGAAAAAGQLGSTPVSTPAGTTPPGGSTGTASTISTTSTTSQSTATPAGGSTAVGSSTGGSK
jgi:Tfp pilus assembly protein PilN